MRPNIFMKNQRVLSNLKSYLLLRFRGMIIATREDDRMERKKKKGKQKSSYEIEYLVEVVVTLVVTLTRTYIERSERKIENLNTSIKMRLRMCWWPTIPRAHLYSPSTRRRQDEREKEGTESSGISGSRLETAEHVLHFIDA